MSCPICDTGLGSTEELSLHYLQHHILPLKARAILHCPQINTKVYTNKNNTCIAVQATLVFLDKQHLFRCKATLASLGKQHVYRFKATLVSLGKQHLFHWVSNTCIAGQATLKSLVKQHLIGWASNTCVAGPIGNRKLVIRFF